jgi:hypothetical protein
VAGAGRRGDCVLPGTAHGPCPRLTRGPYSVRPWSAARKRSLFFKLPLGHSPLDGRRPMQRWHAELSAGRRTMRLWHSTSGHLTLSRRHSVAVFVPLTSSEGRRGKVSFQEHEKEGPFSMQRSRDGRNMVHALAWTKPVRGPGRTPSPSGLRSREVTTSTLNLKSQKSHEAAPATSSDPSPHPSQ